MRNDQEGAAARGLCEALDRVSDERSFVEFLHALAGDWTAALSPDAANPSSTPSSDVTGWENGSLDAFFEAAGTWAEASKNGLRFYNVPTNPWRRAADILFAGKEYE